MPAKNVGVSISRADAVAELDLMMQTLERVHPNLYAVRPRDSVVADRQRIVAALPTSMTRAEWWTHLAPLVASLGDGHTNISYPVEEVAREQRAGALVFPPSVFVNDKDHLAIAFPFGLSGPLAREDRIVSLNGHNADSLMASWIKEVSGESQLFRSISVTDSFRDLLQIHAIHAPYVVTYVTGSGAEREVTITGMPVDSLIAAVRRGGGGNGGRGAGAGNTGGVRSSPNFSFRTMDSGVGYMNFRSMSGDLVRFREDVATMFQQIAADSARALVIDLRTNGGGDSRLGDEVLSYIATKSYRTSSRKEWKMSAEYRAYLKSFVRRPLRWFPVWYFHPLGRKLFRGPDGRIVIMQDPLVMPKHNQPFFTGTVCALIGPRTFSSASDFADAMKTYQLATVIGEETGGRLNTFGEVYYFRLPHSGLPVAVSSARFVRANGDTTDSRGVIPDIEVRQTGADRQAGRDAVLGRAMKSCVR